MLLRFAFIIHCTALLLHAQSSPAPFAAARQRPATEAGAGMVSATGDRWIGVGNGFSGGSLFSVVKDGSLYVICNGDTRGGPHGLEYQYHLVRLDGAGWTEVNGFWCDAEIYSFCSYHDQFYVGGNFLELDYMPGTSGIARLAGDHWEDVAGGFTNGVRGMSVRSMIEYDGNLYIGGEFMLPNGASARNVARWDGTLLSPVGNATDFSSDVIAIDYLSVYHNELYATWSYQPYWDSFDSVGVPGVTRWDGHSWTPLDANARITDMFVCDDNLYVVGRNLTRVGNVQVSGIGRWNGSAWSDGSDRAQWKDIGHLTVHNGAYYATAADGNTVMRWNGTAWDTTGTFDQYLNFLIDYNGGLYAGGWFYTTLNHIARLCESDNCGQIAGSVYNDRNADCNRDAADTAGRNRFVEVTPGPFYAPVGADGSYSLYVPFGSYRVRLHPYLHWSQICQSSPTSYLPTLSASASVAAHNDFAMQPDRGVEDLRMSLAGGHARPGEPGHYVITYSNVGTVPTSGTVRLTLDPLVTFVSSKPGPDRIVGNVIEWDFDNLAVDASRSITVITSVSAATPVGSMVCAMAEIVGNSGGVSLPGDAVLADNFDSFCVRASNSYDPNDLAVTPAGFEDNGEISLSDSVLTYSVRFQNTGNDTAFRVVVIDTIDANIDPTSIRLGAASHPYAFTMSGSRVLIWTFDNILLPDSGASQAGSHGFYKYSVQLQPGLARGTQIRNRVDIYFDYNAPVYTNTVVSVIAAPSGVGGSALPTDALGLYPNPTSGKLLVRGNLVPGGLVQLNDVLGRIVLATTITGNSELALDLSALPAGSYFLSVPTRAGIETRRVTVGH